MNRADECIIYCETQGIPGPEKGERLRVIGEINRKISAAENLEETVDYLFRETRGLLPCDRIAVAFFEEDGRRLTLQHVRADYPPLVKKGYSADVSMGSLRPLFESGRPRIINDLEEYHRLNPGSETARLFLEEGIRSSMTCPLLVEGRVVGVLFRSSRTKNAYSDESVSLHMAISERLSQAVEKAWRIERLQEAMNSYMEMLGFVTHELKSPLDSIIMMGKTLTKGYMGAVDPKQGEFIGRMVRKAEYLSGLVRDYLNLSRFESGNIELRPLKLDFIAEILDEAVEMVRPLADESRAVLEIDTPRPLDVACDRDLMKVVMVNLLGNAVKYGNSPGLVRVKVRMEDRLSVSVWNEGPGFSADDRPRLFRKFSRLEKDELARRRGSGIGLYVTWRIIAAHGGSITAESREGEWAEFRFEMPAR